MNTDGRTGNVRRAAVSIAFVRLTAHARYLRHWRRAHQR